MNLLTKLKNALVNTGMKRRQHVAREQPTDDRLDEVIDWITSRGHRKHIVAVQSMVATNAVERAFSHRGDGRVVVMPVGRLLAGMVFRDANMCLSCTFTLQSEQAYIQLTSRLRGVDPEYNVELDPRIKRHDYARTKPHDSL